MTILNILVACVAVGSLSGKLAASEMEQLPVTKLSSEEVKLQPFQLDQLQSDLPIGDFSIGPDRAVWMIGKSNIWAFDVDAMKLRKVPLAPQNVSSAQGDDELRSIVTDQNGDVFVATDRAMYQFLAIRKQVLKYDFPQQSNLPLATLGVASEGDYVWWINEAGIAKIDRYGHKIIPIGKLGAEPMGHFAIVPSDPPSFWRVDREKIYRHDLSSGGISAAKMVAKLANEIRGIFPHGLGAIGVTGRTLIHMESSGKIVRTIPVEGKRKIVLAQINSMRHSFLYNDRLLEIFQIQDRIQRQMSLPLGRIKKAKKLVVSDQVIGLLGDGMIHLYRYGSDGDERRRDVLVGPSEIDTFGKKHAHRGQRDMSKEGRL